MAKLSKLLISTLMIMAVFFCEHGQSIRFTDLDNEEDNGNGPPRTNAAAQQDSAPAPGGKNEALTHSLQYLEAELQDRNEIAAQNKQKETGGESVGAAQSTNSANSDDQSSDNTKRTNVADPNQMPQEIKEEMAQKNQQKKQSLVQSEENKQDEQWYGFQSLVESEKGSNGTSKNATMLMQLNQTGTEEIVDRFITRKDGLIHLLYSDVNQLLEQVSKEFPDITKVYSIGKSTEGRDINVLELQTPAGNADGKQSAGPKPAILLTGATHAREMISTTMVVYEMLKLIQLGHVRKDAKYSQLLDQNKYIFMPIFNVDGVALIEKNWKAFKKIIPKRKNTNNKYGCVGSDADLGVDLNRNFAVDFGQVDDIVNFQGDLYRNDDVGHNQDGKAKFLNPCFTNYAGPNAFSESETIAFKNFLTSYQNELAFIINIHSNGNAFIYPFNGRQKNDIEERRPGILPIFLQISKEAPFPQGTMKGTSKEVMGLALGGDQDDWALAELGIPSVTAELGYSGQFQDEWMLTDASTGNSICSEQSEWMEYIFTHLPNYYQIVQSSRQQAPAPKQ